LASLPNGSIIDPTMRSNPATSRDSAVVITALGSISAQGHDAASVEESYQQGGSRLGGSDPPVGALSAEAEGALSAFLAEHPRYDDLDRSVKLALYAADQAARGVADRDGMGIMVGSSRGATGLWERYHRGFLASGEKRTPSLTSPTTTLGNLSSWVAQHLGATGPASEMSSTCSTSLYAVGTAMAWLRSGMAARFLAGGTEAPLTAFTIAQMRALRLYSRASGAPYPCRACASDAGRTNSMVLGEGACLLLLELWPPARLRDDRCLGLIRGAGFALESIPTDTALSEEGLALRLSMERALADAGLDRVDAVVTHSPGTALGDRAELNAVRSVFGSDLPVLTSNKWIVGHALGAAGALAVEYALLLLRTGRWVEYPYPVPFTNRGRPIRTVLVNSVGFGGNAASLILASAR
jgi:3-oxoacyl-[acyl-carrier-protein] synthase II